MLRAAIRDPNPVIFLENEILYGRSFDVPVLEDFTIPFGKARIARKGHDVTIVSFGIGMAHALEAAEKLAEGGIEAEVIDLRTLRPIDERTVLESVAKTNRVVMYDEGPELGGWARGLLGAVAERGLEDIDDSWVIASGELPIPYSPTLEDDFLPSAERLADEIRARVKAPARA